MTIHNHKGQQCHAISGMLNFSAQLHALMCVNNKCSFYHQFMYHASIITAKSLNVRGNLPLEIVQMLMHSIQSEKLHKESGAAMNT